MTLTQIYAQIRQQIQDLNDRISVKQNELADLRAMKQALMADRDALAAYLTAQGQVIP